MGVYIIAEGGINANGSRVLALDLMKAAKRCGADAMKWQKRTVEVVYSPADLAKPRESPWGTTTGDQKRGLELSPALATGVGSMFWMHAWRGPIKNVRDVHKGDRFASPGLRLLYRKNGLHISPYHGFMSTAHTDEDITRLIEIHKAAMEELRAQGMW